MHANNIVIQEATLTKMVNGMEQMFIIRWDGKHPEQLLDQLVGIRELTPLDILLIALGFGVPIPQEQAAKMIISEAMIQVLAESWGIGY